MKIYTENIWKFIPWAWQWLIIYVCVCVYVCVWDINELPGIPHMNVCVCVCMCVCVCVCVYWTWLNHRQFNMELQPSVTCVCHDSLTCVIWINHRQYNMAVAAGGHVCVPWLLIMCDMTQSQTIPSESRRCWSRVCAMTRKYVWLDSTTGNTMWESQPLVTAAKTGGLVILDGIQVHIHMCCSVLQCVAACCSLLSVGSLWFSYFGRYSSSHPRVLQRVAVCCSVLL